MARRVIATRSRLATRCRLATRALIAVPLGLWLAGCVPRVEPSSASSTRGSVTGQVLSGSTAIANSTVQLYSAGASSSSGATLLAQTTSDAQGAFSLSFSCASQPPASLLYATASGGSTAGASASVNTAIALLAALGSCTSAPTTIVVNEVTTVAGAYALSAFIGSQGVGGNSIGLTNAVATAGLLADPASGAAGATLPTVAACAADASTPNCEVAEKLGSLANALASCVQSSAASSTPCLALLACATPGATVSDSGGCTAPAAGELPAGVTVPSDTLQAMLSVARNPGAVPVSGLYDLAVQSSTYSGALSAAPNDWTLALAFAGGGLVEPTGLALDASGDVWIADYDNAVTELSPTGNALSPAGGFTGGGLEESFGIAIDANGDVWVSNEQSDPSVNNGLGSVTELAADGSVLSGEQGISTGGLDFPVAVLADASGHVWAANFGDSTLTELAGSGTAVSPDTGYAGGGLAFPVALALDESGNVWAANQGANQISEFASDGTALSPAGGYATGGLAVPQSIVVDPSDDVWVTNAYGDSVTELTDQGIAVSGDGGYTGGGLQAPGGIAIDGAGTVWVANYRGESITALQGSASAAPGTPLTPPTGYTSTSLLLPFALAVDAAGDLWVTSFGNDTVTEFVGIAAPVSTPTIGVPQPP